MISQIPPPPPINWETRVCGKYTFGPLKSLLRKNCQIQEDSGTHFLSNIILKWRQCQKLVLTRMLEKPLQYQLESYPKSPHIAWETSTWSQHPKKLALIICQDSEMSFSKSREDGALRPCVFMRGALRHTPSVARWSTRKRHSVELRLVKCTLLFVVVVLF